MSVHDPAQQSFGDWLRRRRRALDLTQAELARQVGCSAITLRKLEAEERRPSQQVAERLAEVLQVAATERANFLRFARGDPFAAPGQVNPTTRDEPAWPRHNLPLQLTSFIGREVELAEIRQYLTSGIRLLTLTGPGGTGKTRLAAEAAGGLLAAFPDGIWWMELAPLADATLIPQTVASVLGVRGEPDRPLLATLTDHLRRQRVLLILDNCEHLIEACARFAEALLQACPRIALLASSRELLGAAGERVFIVAPLLTPESKANISLEALRRYEAVRLFVDRAGVTAAPFVLTHENAPAVTQVCQRLDGIPLALELGAARLRLLSVDQLAARLDDAFGLLKGGRRTALPRHKTLQALIDWSYNLLPPTEQTLLRRLAVFAGGWTLEAAEGVCAGAGVEPGAVAELLGRLLDKSLVQRTQPAGVVRYRLLETVRQYAQAKLEASGEAEELRRRHAEYYLELANALARPASPWQGRLDQGEREHDNLRAAFGWSRSTPSQIELSVRLAIPLLNFWDGRGYYAYLGEARASFESILARPDMASYPGVKARALWLVGRILAMQGDFRAAEAPLAESLRLFHELGDRPNTASTLFQLGWIARERGDADMACARLEQALAARQELGEQLNICNVIGTLGEAVILQGNVSAAKAMLQANLALARRLGDSNAIGWSLNHLGHVAQLEGDYEQALQLHQASLPLFEQLGQTDMGYVWAHHDLGETALAQSDAQTAAEHFSDALAVAEILGDREALAWCLAGLAGAAEKLRQSLGVREAPCAHDTHERLKAQARAQIGEAAFAAAWGSGEAATLTEAIEHASRAEVAATDRALQSR